jgi:hypothetical protein
MLAEVVVVLVLAVVVEPLVELRVLPLEGLSAVLEGQQSV